MNIEFVFRKCNIRVKATVDLDLAYISVYGFSSSRLWFSAHKQWFILDSTTSLWIMQRSKGFPKLSRFLKVFLYRQIQIFSFPEGIQDSWNPFQDSWYQLKKNHEINSRILKTISGILISKHSRILKCISRILNPFRKTEGLNLAVQKKLQESG